MFNLRRLEPFLSVFKFIEAAPAGIRPLPDFRKTNRDI